MQKLHKFIAKLLTFWIPIASVRRNLRNKIIVYPEINKISKIHKNYHKILKKIRFKVKKGKKINVGFFVIYDSAFQTAPLYEKMLLDDLFNPFIVVIPDTLRGEENMFYQMDKTYKTLSIKYKNIYKSYNEKTKKFINYTKDFDIICTANPYDVMTHPYYRILNFSKKCLSIFLPYSYSGNFQYSVKIYGTDEYNTFWKIFCSNNNLKNLISQKQFNKKDNLITTGYFKMDKLQNYTKKSNGVINILITPHHTVNKIPDNLYLSNFLRLHDFYLELPQIFPNVNFIFRPHPLMFITLVNSKVWTQKQVNEYIKTLKSYNNMVYQEGGDYFETFVNSDALINDCGSFLCEYLYLDYPAMFIKHSDEQIEENFTEFGKEILKCLYVAQDKKDIINFIQNVVIGKNDYKKEQRLEFAKKCIRINYPNSTQFCLDNIKNTILKGNK